MAWRLESCSLYLTLLPPNALTLFRKPSHELTYHIARKKIPVLSEDGSAVVEPADVNGEKGENCALPAPFSSP